MQFVSRVLRDVLNCMQSGQLQSITEWVLHIGGGLSLIATVGGGLERLLGGD